MVQILGGVPRQRQLWGDDQLSALLIGFTRGINDFLGIAHQITDHEIGLYNRNFEHHLLPNSNWYPM